MCNKWFVLPLYKDTLFFNNAEPWLFLFSATGLRDALPNRRYKSAAVTMQVIPCFRTIQLAKVAQSNVEAEWEQRCFPVRLNRGDFFSVRHLPLRAEVTFYSVRDYANFRQLTPPFRKCRIFVPNVLLFAFRVRRWVVHYHIVFRYVSLIFPFVKGKTSGKRSNNDRINDDPSLSLHRAGIRSRYTQGAAIGRVTVGN